MRALLLAAAFALSACATATPYQPASTDRYGYAEQQIENNRYRITFRGNSLTDRTTVETYLLYRAAELTLASGGDYFIIANRDTDRESTLQRSGGSYSAFRHYYYAPHWGWRPWYDPFWDEPSSLREVTRYEAMAEITIHQGQKPADNPAAFDAREVRANLQGRVATPPS